MKAVVAQSASYAKNSNLLSSCSSSSSTSIISSSFLQCKYSLVNYNSANQILGFKGLNLQCVKIIKPFPEKKKVLGVVFASGNDTSENFAQGWLLEPVGDGDCKHIGFKVALPGAYEIFSSDEMVVGRAPEKADLVIPVATVSGSHARVQNKEGSLLVTDLDSTNGTYINEKRVAPGDTEVVPPGSLLTFGDTNLAIFRVSKIEKTLNNEAEEKNENETAEMAAQTEATS